MKYVQKPSAYAGHIKLKNPPAKRNAEAEQLFQKRQTFEQVIAVEMQRIIRAHVPTTGQIVSDGTKRV